MVTTGKFGRPTVPFAHLLLPTRRSWGHMHPKGHGHVVCTHTGDRGSWACRRQASLKPVGQSPLPPILPVCGAAGPPTGDSGPPVPGLPP